MTPSMHLRTALSALLLLSTVSIAVAEETATGSAQPARAAQPTTATLAPEAVVRTADPAAVRPAVRRAPMNADQKAIFDIQELGRAQVADLMKQIEAAPDGPVRRALELKVIDQKRSTEVLVLREIAAQALKRGDVAASREANEAIDAILHPKAPSTELTPRPAPGIDAANR